MSVFWQRSTIAAAVLGDLAPEREERLRAHLRTCDACRAHYDACLVTARALRGSAEATTVEAHGERARLVRALGGPGAADTRTVAARPARWVAFAGLAAAATAVALFVRARNPIDGTPAPEITFRGDDLPGETRAAHVALRVYAARTTPAGPGPVELVADFPGSGEARVPHASLLQFTYKHDLPRPAHLVIATLDEAGHARVVHPMALVDAPLSRTDEPGLVPGGSVDLARHHRPGLLRIYAFFSLLPLDRARLAQAVEAHGDPKKADRIAIDAEQVSGLLRIVP